MSKDGVDGYVTFTTLLLMSIQEYDMTRFNGNTHARARPRAALVVTAFAVLAMTTGYVLAGPGTPVAHASNGPGNTANASLNVACNSDGSADFTYTNLDGLTDSGTWSLTPPGGTNSYGPLAPGGGSFTVHDPTGHASMVVNSTAYNSQFTATANCPPPTKTPEAPSSVLFGAGVAFVALAAGYRARRRRV